MEALVKDIDYTINAEGNLVFTMHYHQKRGYCCKNKCINCPWLYGKSADVSDIRNK